jgi:membrane carboxypeptidase/penicillin-binding protein
MDFFAPVIADAQAEAKAEGIVDFAPPDFDVPPNLVFVEIDKKTGLLATPVCRFPFREVFVPGTEPSRYCTLADHLRILDYYSNEKATEEH